MISSTDGTLWDRIDSSLDGVGDLNDKKETLTFAHMPVEGELVVTVYGQKKEITEVNNLARINAPRHAPVVSGRHGG